MHSNRSEVTSLTLLLLPTQSSPDWGIWSTICLRYWREQSRSRFTRRLSYWSALYENDRPRLAFRTEDRKTYSLTDWLRSQVQPQGSGSNLSFDLSDGCVLLTLPFDGHQSDLDGLLASFQLGGFVGRHAINGYATGQSSFRRMTLASVRFQALVEPIKRSQFTENATG